MDKASKLVNKDKPYVVAYYLFKYSETALRDLGYRDKDTAYIDIAAKLDMRYSYIKPKTS